MIVKPFLNSYLAAKDGALASEHIVDVIDKIVAYSSKFSMPTMRDRSKGWFISMGRCLKKCNKRTRFRRHRDPGIAAEEVKNQLSRYQDVLGISA